jgi:hypothetical protein
MPEKRKDLIWIKRIAMAIALGLTVYFITMTVIIPVSRYKIEIPEDKSGNHKTFRPGLNWLLTLSDSLKNRTIDLISSESFLLSRLEMTKSDSISMAISLKDSTVVLVMQGVTIYSAKIQAFRISHAFNKTDPFVLAHWLSSPFIIDKDYASIPKVPVLYKKAPKDTIEAMSQLELDPLKDDLDPVYYSLNLDRKLVLSFEQSEKPEKGYSRHWRIYKKQIRSIKRKNILHNLVRFTPGEFIPEIKIVLDRKAARVIYRAIPVNAFVAIQLQTE